MFTTNFRLLLKVWLTLKCLLLLKYMFTISSLGIIVRIVAIGVIHTSIKVFFLSLWKSVKILLWVFSSAHVLFIITEKQGFLTITDDTGITLVYKHKDGRAWIKRCQPCQIVYMRKTFLKASPCLCLCFIATACSTSATASHPGIPPGCVFPNGSAACPLRAPLTIGVHRQHFPSSAWRCSAGRLESRDTRGVSRPASLLSWKLFTEAAAASYQLNPQQVDIVKNWSEPVVFLEDVLSFAIKGESVDSHCSCCALLKLNTRSSSSFLGSVRKSSLKPLQTIHHN